MVQGEDAEIRLHAVHGCGAAGPAVQDHLLVVGQQGKRVHLMRSRSPPTGSVFYPGKFSARVQGVRWSQQDKVAEVTDQYDNMIKFECETSSNSAIIDGDIGVYHKFEIQPLEVSTEKTTEIKSEDSEQTENKSAFCLPFFAKQCENVSLVGGKGASLSRLARQGRNVPPGVCLTTHMFEQAIRQHQEVQKALVAIQKCASVDDLEELCKAAECLIRSSGMARDFMDITEAMGESLMGPTWETRLAIRSSGVDEDGTGTSTAGQNETLLGIAAGH